MCADFGTIKYADDAVLAQNPESTYNSNVSRFIGMCELRGTVIRVGKSKVVVVE